MSSGASDATLFYEDISNCAMLPPYWQTMSTTCKSAPIDLQL